MKKRWDRGTWRAPVFLDHHAARHAAIRAFVYKAAGTRIHNDVGAALQALAAARRASVSPPRSRAEGTNSGANIPVVGSMHYIKYIKMLKCIPIIVY